MATLATLYALKAKDNAGISMRLLKDLIQNKRQLRSAMNKPRMPMNLSSTHAVAFKINGDVLEVVGFR